MVKLDWKKMESCGMNIIKFLLFIFNFFFALSGLGLIIAGATVLADVGEFSHFIEGRVFAPPIVLIVAGVLIFLVASLGCYGAFRESPPLLNAFAVCLLVIFIIELAVGFAAVAFKADLEEAINKSLESSIKRRSTEDMIAWNNVHRKLMCCGINSPKDWYDQNNRTMPASCCKPELIEKETQDCRNAAPLFMDRYYQEGCLNKLKERVEGNATTLIGTGIGIAFIQILGIFLACWLSAAIRREDGAK